MITEEYEMELVWSGSHVGVYLGALKGIEPFQAHDMGIAHVTPEKPMSTGDLILAALRSHGPQTQSQLTAACNRSHREVRTALKRRAESGEVVLEQPTLLAIDPHDGQRWRLA